MGGQKIKKPVNTEFYELSVRKIQYGRPTFTIFDLVYYGFKANGRHGCLISKALGVSYL